jgi:hypothetical protein
LKDLQGLVNGGQARGIPEKKMVNGGQAEVVPERTCLTLIIKGQYEFHLKQSNWSSNST